MSQGVFFKRGYSATNFSTSALALKAFCDADWAGDPNDKKSTTGFVILLNDTHVSWCSKETAMSRSSTEVEKYGRYNF